jgi:hypothetical protein
MIRNLSLFALVSLTPLHLKLLEVSALASPNKIHDCTVRRQCILATLGFASAQLPTQLLQQPARAQMMNTDELLKGLQEASPDKPQIPFPNKIAPSNNNKNQQQSSVTVVQGLVYFEDPEQQQQLILGSSEKSVLVLTIHSVAGDVLAGAKLPIRKLPVRFSMTEQNALPGKTSAFLQASSDQDLIVHAYVCRSSSSSNTVNEWKGEQAIQACANASILGARGVAKLLQFPSVQSIRAPVSLPLETQKI